MSSEQDQNQDQTTPETPPESAPTVPEPTQTAESEPEVLETDIGLNLQVGKTYPTRGGWPVILIWYHAQSGFFYGIHKPLTPEEHPPTCHSKDGKAITMLSVSAPPDYGQHPADIISDTPIED